MGARAVMNRKKHGNSKRRNPALKRLTKRGSRLSDAPLDTWPDADPHGERYFLEAEHGFAPRTGHTAARYATYQFEQLFDAGIRPLSKRLSATQATELAAAVGKRGMSERLLMSNSRVRLKATDLLIREVMRVWRSGRDSGRRWFLLSFIGDVGNSLEYRPRVRLEPMHDAVDKLIRQAGLHAFTVLEIQTLTNFPQHGYGGTLMVNAHAIAWTDDPDFDARAMEKKLCASRRLATIFSAPTVDIQPIGDTERDLRFCCYYLLKAPYVGKSRVPSSTPGRQWELIRVELRPGQVVRLMEGLMQVDLNQVTFAVGGGNAIARPWRKALREWHRAELDACRGEAPALPHDYDMAELCGRLRGGRVAREPYRFLRNAAADTDWLRTANAALAQEQAERENRQREWRSRGEIR